MRYARFVFTALGMAIGIAFSGSPAAAQCEWCNIEMTGTEITGYNCDPENGVYQLDDCEAVGDDPCSGDIYNCWQEEENLPDLTVIAVLSDCGRNASEIAPPQVVADVWRGVRLPLREAELDALPATIRGSRPTPAPAKF